MFDKNVKINDILLKLNKEELTADELELNNNQLWTLLNSGYVYFSKQGGGKLRLSQRSIEIIKDILNGVSK